MPIDCPAARSPWPPTPTPPRTRSGSASTGRSATASRSLPPGRQQPQAAPGTTVSVKVYAGHGLSPPATAAGWNDPGDDQRIGLVRDAGAGAVGRDVEARGPGDGGGVAGGGRRGRRTRPVVECYTVDDTVSGLTDCCGSGGGARARCWWPTSWTSSSPTGRTPAAHTAKASGPAAWQMTVGKEQYTLANGRRLVIRGPSATAASKAIEASPFSATFPGAIFGAKGDVVVTVAPIRLCPSQALRRLARDQPRAGAHPARAGGASRRSLCRGRQAPGRGA